MNRKSLVAIAAFAAPALLAPAILPTTASAKELTAAQSLCAAKKPQKLGSTTAPPQRRENRRVPIGWPPKIKTLDGKPMW
jgi:hypothetical protein